MTEISHHSKYKKDLFQGMTIECDITKTHKVRFIIFPNGKLNCTGIKRLEDLPLIEDKREMFRKVAIDRVP